MDTKFNIQDLAELVARKNKISRKEAETFVRTFFDTISTYLLREKIVKVKGLGTFKMVEVSDRESVDVNTGRRIMIEGHSKVSFTPDNTLRDQVNKPFCDFETVILNEDTDIAEMERIDTPIPVEDTDSIDDEAGDESSESFDSDEDIDDEEFFVAQKDSDVALADEDVEEKIGKSSAQGVLINDKEKSSDSERSLDIFDSSTLLTLAGFIVGLAILIIGITYYASSSDRVVDNVLSGETAGLAIFLIIIGLIIIGFSLLKFFSSSKSSLIIDTFNSIKSIDYDEISEDGFSREDFDAIFGILKRKKDSNFSDSGDNDKSVDWKSPLIFGTCFIALGIGGFFLLRLFVKTNRKKP